MTTHRADGGLATLVGWSYSEATTRQLAQRTQELLHSREYAGQLASRYAKALPAHFEGRLFEWVEALKFNLDAIGTSSQLRAVTTAQMDLPAAPADIWVRLPNGRIVREVQAKAYGKVTEGLRAASAEKYAGMGRLLPSDQTEHARRLLGDVMDGPPERLNRSRYADVLENLLDGLEHDDVASAGTDRAELKRIAQDPEQWLDAAIRRSAASEIGKSAAAGAVAGGGFGFVFSAAWNGLQVHRGETTGSKAIIDTVAVTAATAVRGGSGCALAKAIQIAARRSDQLEGFASTAGPAAVSNAVIEVGIAGYRFSKGDLTSSEFVETCGKTLIKNSAAWAYGAIGQTLIPVPVVGTLVGATVGYVAAATVVEGLKLAYITAREADAAEEELAELEGWIFDAIQRLEETRLAAKAVNEHYGAHFDQAVLPLMDGLEKSLLGDGADALGQLAALCQEFDASLPFQTLEEFDEFMTDPNIPLVL